MSAQAGGIRGWTRRLLSCETVSYEEMMALLLPLLAENIFTVGMTLLNSAMVSSSGMATLSAVTLIDTYMSMVIHVFQGVATGASIIVAQYHGARKNDLMRESAVSSISIVTLFGTILSVLSILLRHVIIGAFFGAAEAQVLSIAAYYMLGNCLSMPLHAFVAAQLGCLRGVGEGKTALFITIINSIVYVTGNLVFLVVLKMSVTGLIISIGLTRLITFLACFAIKHWSKSVLRFSFHELFRPEFRYLKRIVLFGFPISFENLLFDGGRMILQTIVTPLGTDMIAGYNIAYNLMTFLQIPNNSMSSAIFVGAGMCMGAGRPDDLKRWYKKIFVLNTATYAVVCVLMTIFHVPVISLFNVDAYMIPRIFRCLAIIMVVLVVSHTAGFMDATIMRAAGDVTFATVISAVSMWVFRVLFGYIFSRVMGLGIEGVCLGMALDWTFRAIVFRIRYRKGRWERMHVI